MSGRETVGDCRPWSLLHACLLCQYSVYCYTVDSLFYVRTLFCHSTVFHKIPRIFENHERQIFIIISYSLHASERISRLCADINFLAFNQEFTVIVVYNVDNYVLVRVRTRSY